MTKAKRYDTVVLLEAINGFQKGEKGAAVEVYTTPYEAYDIEIVTDLWAQVVELRQDERSIWREAL
jgi:hypothetical protein